jgi:hypothetical protein
MRDDTHGTISEQMACQLWLLGTMLPFVAFASMLQRDRVSIFRLSIVPRMLPLAMRAVGDNQRVELDEGKAVPIDLNTGRDLLLRLWAGDDQCTHDNRLPIQRDNHKASKELGS